MADKEIRLLHADEIECRVSMVTETGVSLLLYKDARVDQRILDETFTTFGWKRSHQVIDGNLYCTVEVWDTEKSQWIGKQDVGKESYAEKEKGQASDSFKRACVNWGRVVLCSVYLGSRREGKYSENQGEVCYQRPFSGHGYQL